jgi:hypothetical protein
MLIAERTGNDMRIKTDAVGQIVPRSAEDRWVEHPWREAGSGEADNDNEDARDPTSMWEAEISALDSEQLQTLQESVEDQ